MSWLKRNLRRIGIIVTAGLLLAWAIWMSFSVLGIQQAGRAPAINTGTVQAVPTVDTTAVAQDQLKQQDEMLQRENSFPWTILNVVGGSIGTIVVGAAALIAAWLGYKQWRGNREEERRKRDEERFQAVVEGLGSEREEAKVGAAIMLRTFLRKGYEQFYRQTFDLAVAHLRLPRNFHSSEDPDGIPHLAEDRDAPMPLTTLMQALIVIFKEAFPLARSQNKGSPQSLDATGIHLDNAYLSRADLKEVWMQGAFLRKADLSEAKLRGADLKGVKLEDALSLKDTDLRGVNGLTQEQKEICKAKGAIVDEDVMVSASQPSISPLPPSQSNEVQTPSAPPVQGSTPTSDSGESSAASSEPN